jgi:predicted Zn-dependent peptidase
MGFAGPKADSADHIVIELIQAAMNGRGGRLLQEIRDKQSVVVDAAMDGEALFLAGAIYVQATSTPDNEQRARAALASEFERLARAGLSADEIDAARAMALTSNIASLQSQHLRALEYAWAIVYQREAATVDALGDQLSKLTTEDIKRVAAVYLKPSLASSGIVRGIAPSSIQSPTKN